MPRHVQDDLPHAHERGPLERLLRRADAVGEDAEAAIRKALREVRAEIALLARETDVGRSAAAREAVLDAARKRLARLRRRLERLTGAAAEYAARQGFDAGLLAAGDAARAEGGGLDVHYSKERADEICALVTEGQGGNLAAVFTENMAENVVDALRSATVSAMRENAVAGGTMEDLARTLEDKWLGAAKDGETFRFVDAGGHVWDTRTYVAMNVRTNAMRVYNDSLADTIGRATGSDLVRVSRGGDPHCRLCFPWEGRILSLTGGTKGFPTYEQAREAGCFHPNCVHTLEAVDELLDEEEIALQKAHPVDMETATPEELDGNRYEIDQDRYRRQGMDAERARLAVDRDNLEAEIRAGLLREDAREIVDGMTDAQVAALCPDGNPPRFEPVKRVRGGTRREPKYEPERWRHGSRGGVVHVRRDADLAHILGVCNVKDAGGKAGGWTPQTDLEKATDALMRTIGAKHTEERKDPLKSNPRFGDYRADDPNRAFCINCQRCVPTAEARFRGYDVTALPRQTVLRRGRIVGDDKDELYRGIDRMNDAEFFFPTFKDAQPISYRREEDIEAKMREWGDGSRAQITCKWKGRKSGGHTFMVVQENGKTRFIDPQTGSEDCAWYFRNIKRDRKYNFFARIDNLSMNDRMKLCCNP